MAQQVSRPAPARSSRPRTWSIKAGLPLARTALLVTVLITALACLSRADSLPLREGVRRISVDFHEADIKSVLLAFSEFSGVSILASKNVTGKVTARITDIPWDRALYSLLENNGLAVRESNGILNVDTIENIRATEKLEDLATRIFKLNYQKSQEIGPTVSALLSERGKLQADEGTNSIMVIDIPDRIAKIGEVLDELDQETRQVEISVQLSFINQRKLRELGIDWHSGNLTNPLTDTRFDVGVRGGQQVTDAYGNLAVGTVRKGVNLSMIINTLESMNKARTVAKPVITTLNNLQAKVLVGQRTPLRVVDYGAVGTTATAARATTEMVETGVKLEVTPQITENNKILVEIHAENSNAASGPEGVFFNTQEASTRLLLDNEQTGVIAGLTVNTDTKVKSGVPGVSKIPVLGRLFSYDKNVNTEEELVIIIQAKILTPTDQQESGQPSEPQTPGERR